MGLVVGAEPSRALSLGILDRRPRPLVAIDEVASFVRRVRDVDAEVLDLRMGIFEVCVGDRLALACASP
jgi:hypothetical protein